MMCAWLVALCCSLIVLSSPAWVLLNHNLPTTLHTSVEECSSRGDSERLAWPAEVPSRRRRALLPASDLCTSRNFYLRNRKVRKNIRSSDVNRGGRDCEISAEGGHAQSLSLSLSKQNHHQFRPPFIENWPSYSHICSTHNLLNS